MNKYIISIVSILSIGIIVISFGLGRYSLVDTESLFGWGRFKPFPEELRQKYTTTIGEVDSFIMEKRGDEITSRSEKFNLENYLGVIMIGVLPYLEDNDPLKQNIQLLTVDISKYIKANKYYWNKLNTN